MRANCTSIIDLMVSKSWDCTLIQYHTARLDRQKVMGLFGGINEVEVSMFGVLGPGVKSPQLMPAPDTDTV